MSAGRPRTRIGDIGKISEPKLLSTGRFQVSTSLRTASGEKRITASGMSKLDAKEALNAKWKRIANAAEPGIDKDPLFKNLGSDWLGYKTRKLAVQSIQRYGATLCGSVGPLRVRVG